MKKISSDETVIHDGLYFPDLWKSIFILIIFFSITLLSSKINLPYSPNLPFFFAEEEERIMPILKEGLSIAQKQAAIQPIPELLEDLSHGVKLENIDTYKRIVLAPSYWTSPLIFFNNPKPDELLVVFGCREDDQNLVPGEYVPETLVTALKAMADPTRLRILHYLNQGATTPSSLARLLRLRAPTVIHHLNTMRLAGLIQVTLTANGERRYSLRQEAIEDTFKQFNMVLRSEKKEK